MINKNIIKVDNPLNQFSKKKILFIFLRIKNKGKNIIV